MEKARGWITIFVILSLLFTACAREAGEEPGSVSMVPQTTVTVEDSESIDLKDNGMRDGLLEWDERHVVIPELKREYEIWFLADSHIIIPDDSESEEVQVYTAERLPAFVNRKDVAPSQILTEFIALANEQKPDMLLFGGDILDFPSEANVAFLKEELSKLTVPYVYVMGNHDWTFPWEYMTPEGAAQYRLLYDKMMYGNFALETVTGEKTVVENDSVVGEKGALEAINISGNSYSSVIELEDLIILAVDDSSNQVAAEAVEYIEHAYDLGKPVVLMQHVPFSTEKLIVEVKNYWNNPVTIGMHVHGGLAPNDVSADLYSKVREDESNIRVVLAGHVHFPYEEKLAAQTVEIITGAAYKGKATKLHLVSE